MFVLFCCLFGSAAKVRVCIVFASFYWQLQYRFYKVIEIIDTLSKFL